METKTPIQVIIVWMSSRNDDVVNSLSYNNGNGPVRVYDKDKHDPRVLSDVFPAPYFGNSVEASQWMLANRDKCCQVPLYVGRLWGYDV